MCSFLPHTRTYVGVHLIHFLCVSRTDMTMATVGHSDGGAIVRVP